jgi:hypothetical protein
MKALHRTDYNSGVNILRSGFDLTKFGSATKKTGQANNFRHHARGIFLSEDWGANPEELPPHPWDHRDRGVYIFGDAQLQKPFECHLHMDGIFYQEWLSKKYGDKVKAQLTAAMQKDGYDGIYVAEAGEITVFNPNAFIINKNKSVQSIKAYEAWKSSAGKGFKEWLIATER